MALSTTSLLEAVNRVLLANGEREQRQLNTPTSYLAKDCIRDALEHLITVDDWEWGQLIETPPFTSWTGSTVQLTNLHRLHGVSFFNAACNAFEALEFLDLMVFDSRPPLPVTDRTPTVYTQIDDVTFKFNQAPTLAESSLFRFYLTKRNIMPSLDSDKFNLSEQGIPMLVSLAAAKFAQRHSGEQSNAQFFMNEFADQAQGMRNHKRLRPSTPFNIYRTRGGFGQW